MNRKKLNSEDMESSSSEDADEGVGVDEEKVEESASDSGSSDDDEFDSADDRVNIVPSQTPSETLKLSAQGESSEESKSEENDNDDEEEDPKKLAMKPSEKIEGIKHFDSDVDSEYEGGSSSESEGLTKEGSIQAVEALPLTQKKAKKVDTFVNPSIAEDDRLVKKGKDKFLKQQQDPKPAKIIVEENPPAKRGQGAVKQILKDTEQSQSLKDEKERGHSAKISKLEFSRLRSETDSADSLPISKRRKYVDAAQNGKELLDRDKLAHSLGGTGKEIARKTLCDPSANTNGSKDALNNKVLTVDHVSMPEKKANTDSSKGPTSPQKQKKLPHVWSTDEEIMMVSEVLNRVKLGLEVPSKKNDDFWLTLSELLHKKLGIDFSRDQLSEKLRRMKQRYRSMVERIKESRELQKPFKFKKSNEQNWFDICSQIWGRSEVTSLDVHEATKKTSKPLEAAASLVKEDKSPMKVANFRPTSKGKASKKDVVATTDNSAGRDAVLLNMITATPMKLDKGKEDHAKDGLSSLPDESAVLSKDVYKLLQGKIHATLNELQEWSKNSMEAWMNKALTQIDRTLKTLGDQARHMNAMGIAGGALPMRLCDSIEFQFVHGEEAFQQQWYELHLQELNIYAQRLELMQKECQLKQEQLKLQLQIERGK